MKKYLLSILTVNFFFLSSCALLNPNNVRYVIEKIDNKDYVVDLRGGLYDHEGRLMIYTCKFIHVHGDSLICYTEYSKTESSSPIRTECFKYEISKYDQKRTPRGRTEIYFWLNRYTKDGSPVDNYVYFDEIPKRIIFRIALSGRVRVYINDEPPVIGVLR